MRPTAKLQDDFLAHRQVPGVALEHNTSVEVVGGPHVGGTGSVVSVEELGTDPTYLVELSSGQDVFVRQSLLRRELIVVTELRNDTLQDMHVYLEMVPEELVMAPGHDVQLLARPSAELLPLNIAAVEGGLQIHAWKEVDPDWHVRFHGKVIKVQVKTRLTDHE